jgi:hypothetical protein
MVIPLPSCKRRPGTQRAHARPIDMTDDSREFNWTSTRVVFLGFWRSFHLNIFYFLLVYEHTWLRKGFFFQGWWGGIATIFAGGVWGNDQSHEWAKRPHDSQSLLIHAGVVNSFPMQELQSYCYLFWDLVRRSLEPGMQGIRRPRRDLVRTKPNALPLVLGHSGPE